VVNPFSAAHFPDESRPGAGPRGTAPRSSVTPARVKRYGLRAAGSPIYPYRAFSFVRVVIHMSKKAD